MALRRKWLWILGVTVGWVAAFAMTEDRCAQAWLRYGIEVYGACPDGTPRQTAMLHATGLRRGAPGRVYLRVDARYAAGDDEGRATLPWVWDASLAVIGGGRPEAPLAVTWDAGNATAGEVALPDLPDGDYQLRARFTTPLGPGEVTAPLALYAPARIHVLTDRPLYEPGNTVRFRAVVLRASDLAPLDGRPGTWVVRDPDNEVLLEDKAAAAEWGVIAGSFPLDKLARPGTWKVAWRSADASDEVAFEVKPFTLPRFRVDAAPGQAFYRAGERPRIAGAVIYASGAPVANANIEVSWRVDGAWPPPAAWLQDALPRRAQTGANGRFALELPEVPRDLQGTARLIAQVAAVDAAGDRVAGAATVLLSEDAIQAQAVTELGDGLVDSFNNRVYLRVATPDGRVVARTRVTIKRAWLANDAGIAAELDEDGVASVQLDPGKPINLVIPAAPYRPAPRPPLVTRGEPREVIANQGASLADQLAFDRWLASVAPCARYVEGSAELRVGMRVASSGAVIAANAGTTALERCVATAATRLVLPAGGERLYALPLSLREADLPTLAISVDAVGAVPDELDAKLVELARGARDCLPAEDGALAELLNIAVHAGRKEVALTGWLADRGAVGGRAALACVKARFARLALDNQAASDALGVVRFHVASPASDAAARPQPTTMLGYELRVIADLPGAPTTIVRLPPGAVPPLRLRVEPVVAKPGDTVAAQLIRGPSFHGALPAKLALDCLRDHSEHELDAERHAAIALPKAAEGWCRITGAGLQALVYVRPASELALTVTPAQDRYAPRAMASLKIQTARNGVGTPAAVGLFGVDDSLSQLVPLPGADAFGRIRPAPTTSAPAFGVLDGQALALGRIRGANAAAATVLRVSSIPSVPELDAVVSSIGESAFDPVAELTDRFYVVLAELHAQVRAWEAKAPAKEKMVPATMARLWRAALAACVARGERVDDAYGRELRLAQLPGDLLALVDPRAVVAVATRLPEDVENWSAWVARERP